MKAVLLLLGLAAAAPCWAALGGPASLSLSGPAAETRAATTVKGASYTERQSTLSNGTVLHEYVDAGGLLSYGPNIIALFRRAAEYADRIARGAKPADLPIEQPTKFEVIVNLKTARALGINIPTPILLRADEVIE